MKKALWLMADPLYRVSMTNSFYSNLVYTSITPSSMKCRASAGESSAGTISSFSSDLDSKLNIRSKSTSSSCLVKYSTLLSILRMNRILLSRYLSSAWAVKFFSY